MILQRREPDVIGQQLMMFSLALALVILRIPLLEFFENSRGQALVDKIICVLADYARAIDLHTAPLPATKPKHLLIKLVWKPLCPSSKFLLKEFIKDGLQCHSVTEFLVSRGFINERDNADMRHAAQQNVGFCSNNFLPRAKNSFTVSVNPDFADLWNYICPESRRSYGSLNRSILNWLEVHATQVPINKGLEVLICQR